MVTQLFYRMKHSNITYDAITRATLIDNYLIKALEIAKARKLKLAKIREGEMGKAMDKAMGKAMGKAMEKVIEMSESHDTKPYIKK